MINASLTIEFSFWHDSVDGYPLYFCRTNDTTTINSSVHINNIVCTVDEMGWRC